MFNKIHGFHGYKVSILPKEKSFTQNPLMVSQLIDHDSQSWKANIIHNLFKQEFAHAILW